MNHNLFDHVNVDKAKTFVPDGKAADLAAEGKAYDERIEALGGIDIQLLGIGLDGHIGFNEPDAYLIPGTHVTDLTESTIEANARFFDSPDSVPKKALTMGIGTILAAKKIVLMVSGADKKAAVMRLLENKITTQCPATMLNLHANVTLVVTEDAIDR
jgi:glucosamine-6-phosphate deaminase